MVDALFERLFDTISVSLSLSYMLDALLERLFDTILFSNTRKQIIHTNYKKIN